jgi:tRNA A-37 threonylcarbamoyl transferase component Bud32
LAEAQKGLEEYAKYTYRLHKCGIFHKDYSTSNILFNDNGGNYEFSLIDDNRLLFRSYSRTRSMITMVKRQDISVEQMGIIAGSYAELQVKMNTGF